MWQAQLLHTYSMQLYIVPAYNTVIIIQWFDRD